MNQEILVSASISIKEALRTLNRTAMKVLFVVEDDSVLRGSLTDGDIRRAILRGDDLDAPVEAVFNQKPVFVLEGEYDDALISQLFTEKKIEIIPVLNNSHKILEIITWNAFFSEEGEREYSGTPIDLPVVIMAGGKGVRMAPFTNVLPKPLIPIGDKTILETIMAEFAKFGVTRFFLTVNYRGEMIRAYLEGQPQKYSIQYVWEKEFLGTAGSLRLAAEQMPESFFVSNCDILVRANYAEVAEFHRKSGASLTIISSIQHHQVPYGVVDFKAGGEVVSVREKPEFAYTINTGVYVLQKHCLGYIPENRPYHMTHLIEALMKDGHKVVTYLVSENEYVDIGQWDVYREAVSKMKV